MGQHSSTVNDTPCLRRMMLDRIEGENAVTKQKKERLLALRIVRAITIEEFKECNDGLKNQLKAQESQYSSGYGLECAFSTADTVGYETGFYPVLWAKYPFLHHLSVQRKSCHVLF